MKKFIAILLSVLMLCAVVPFATVAAANDVSIDLAIVDELEEVSAGDEFQVEVYINGLSSTSGLIAATVQIDFDRDVFDLVTYFDEDEEMWMPPIEVGSKYNASSNKYIMFGQIDEETGYMKDCLVKYTRATASATQVRKEAHFYTVTLKVKDDAVSGTYDLAISDTTMGGKTQLVCHGNIDTPFDKNNASIVVNGKDPEPEVPSCEHEYFDACSPICEKCGEEREVSHNIVAVDAVSATCTTDGNIAYWYCDKCGAAWADEALTLVTNLKSVTLPASCSYSAVYTAAKDATCDEPGNVEYWYCANCDVYYADAACAIVTNAKNVIIPISHNVIHVEAKDATCTTEGNIEYWYCDICGSAWLDELCHLNTNLKAVKLGATCANSAVYTEAKAATCFEPGNTEYWYCANCDVYYADAACTIITNAKNVIIPIAHNVIHVEAKAATCAEMGNIEYWYCADCGQAWLDELCHLNTNLKAVVLPATGEHRWSNLVVTSSTCFESGYITITCGNCGKVAVSGVDAEADQYLIDYPFFNLDPAHKNIVAVEAKAATCTEMGNIAYWYCEDCGMAWLDAECTMNTNLKAVVLPVAEHTYDNAYDADCNICGNIREIVLGADEIIVENGQSIRENKFGTGLAVKFDAYVDGIVYDEEYIANYDNATVTIDGVEYKLVGMGAIANNKGYAAQTLENVDGTYVLNIPAVKVIELDGELCYFVRILDIPAEHLDTDITFCSYFQYEKDGEIITVYGDDIVSSYNAVLG